MPIITREVKEGTQYQGADEEVYYKITTTPWGSTPSSTGASAYTVSGSTYTDVSTTVLTGSTSVSGDVITLPKLSSLTEGTAYRIEVGFTESNGNVYECYFHVQCER